MASNSSDAGCTYNFLGRSGLKVSSLCLGTLTFGERPGMSGQLKEDAAHAILDGFAARGGNFIDTSDNYGNGNAERMLGSWLARQDRQKFVIATKVRKDTGLDDVNGVGLSRRHITAQLERSLERLQTHYVDLYQIHTWDTGTPVEETLRTMEDLVRCGKVGYLGGSNLQGWHLQKMADLARFMGLPRVISLQQQYSLLSRESELDAFEVCHLEGIAVMPWSPLKGGLLTDKFSRGEAAPSQKTRVGMMTRNEAKASDAWPSWNWVKDDEKYWSIRDALQSIGNKHGKTSSQVALKWLLQKPLVASVVIGVTSPEQLDSNMAAASPWSLSPEEMQKLNDVSSYPIPYPQEHVRQVNGDSRVNVFNF